MAEDLEKWGVISFLITIFLVEGFGLVSSELRSALTSEIEALLFAKSIVVYHALIY